MKIKGWQKKFYDHSPIWLQNLYVSAYGWRRHRDRYGGQFRAYVEELLRSQWYTPQEFEEIQIQSLQNLLQYAYDHVPYYRRVFDEHDVIPRKINSLSDFSRQVPILPKDELRRNNPQFFDTNVFSTRWLEFHTSGSTGTPITVHVHLDDFRKHMAFLERQRRWAGVTEGQRCATFGGTLIVPARQRKPIYWRYNCFGQQLLFSSYHMSDRNLPFYAHALEEFQPVILEGYPSAIYLLAQWLDKRGSGHGIHPAAILCTAETLSIQQRQLLERVFSAPVYNYYSSSECAPFIGQCEKGSLHINPESGIFEFLRPDGAIAQPGEVARMIVTTFHSRGTPLIRYDIRDYAVVGNMNCACGRMMPVVEEVVGREDDFILSPDRGYVGRLSQVMKVFPGTVREAQITQETPVDLVIRLVPDGVGPTQADIDRMLHDLRQRVGYNMHIKVLMVDNIERGPNGKFRYVVNKILQASSDTSHQGSRVSNQVSSR